MQKKYFSNYREPLATLPYLPEIQLESWRWFLADGLKELFKESSPIRDYGGEDLDLEFVDYSLDEPKYDEYQSKAQNASFDATLRVKARLTNKKTGEIKEQEIFLADMPLMTPRGTFIVNGVERVIVSQLARSFGVYFTANFSRGKKYFGAKIIPSRGAWIEFESDADGALYARIDRKRKIPASCILRIFGIGTNEEILSKFTKDSEVNPIIKKMLDKDPTKSANEAYMEIYKRLRPGEPATMETAKDLISVMFSEERYDLSSVGRYKLNQRLGLSDNPTSRILSGNDLVKIILHILTLNSQPNAEADDVDHVGNRRIRSLGELLQQRLRVGMTRMKRTIQDRMSTLDQTTLTPAHLINARPFMAILKEFFTTNQLSQFMNQVNVLSELEHLRRLSALGPGGLTRERAGFEVRDVHPSHYGRICPIETPEGPNIGLVVHLAGYARVNEYGILETPYRKVKDGKIMDEIQYMTAFEDAKYNIAQAGTNMDKDGVILDDETEGRVKGSPGLMKKGEIDFIEVASEQAFSIATTLIPFLAHDDANRAMMGSNMQRQAVPCIKPQAPLVGTGVEERAARDSGRLMVADEDGVISQVDASKVVLKSSKKEYTYPLVNFLRSNDFTVINQRPVVDLGQAVKKGDVLADTSSSDHGVLALGQNLLVAFLSWGGANFEDAIILSERLVKDDTFSSIHIEDFMVDVRDTKLGPEITTHDIPNVSEEKLKDLDEEGIIRIGAEVRSGDILVGKITPKGEVELTPEERLLRAIFGEKARDVKDTSMRVPHGKAGRVVGIKVFSRERGDKLDTGVIKRVQVEIAQLRKISVGDKLAGRHGNKGVISKILPIEEMPYLPDGTPVDIILNPLGVASRMNIGQILETHLGWAAKELNYQAVTPALNGASEDEIKGELKKAGLPEHGKIKLFDGRTGEPFDQEVTVGMIYMMKLIHMVEDKIHMRSIGPYSLITQQPLGGKAQGGGQRFGEMEVWALEGYGAAHTLQEMITIKSDDVLGRAAAYDAIVRGEKFKSPNLPASFHVLVNELKALGLDVDLKGIKEEVEKNSKVERGKDDVVIRI
ncbi:DNA-directed RNA polymerase subunit beta [Candidatus Giovannonibacteria bacterium RIFCSPLOWO2_02_FULL_45_14]|uniref:DNA-directed RNA polymerase subunit beta n=1 Tax=Candidatus Giovannonibacteria bacterium RIFCSPLOWO2_12_FULL_44_15 TaxID=1798364 RepID=A0A1F5XYZ2_9BACT|nr:MAG: DNA-directed RNA polymerase subunit beta [Candidatus Giovannonibacteria bacterium RIFCSPHIGHO2_02_FULL_44_31]OGF76760.1 MAG: DNA-directed RNA polymerase subunit beta [Candidatus Giovannonibacteria bacterium RIFCSPHIGHO2_12_FULL_44_29]OGF91264.1 MAG: DNA-directed RNA polymerase subunit beta [Candidatus Giovannonibacteria bacterium RIFCSPLOWO2_02_FULL_45_14]OGF93116.1 MAG: DNA-directed RNA polymerase subunit beta [Candidatus Giovannonibacteria bacterium RIFCSPLOWO2_12_FULL_44_15]